MKILPNHVVEEVPGATGGSTGDRAPTILGIEAHSHERTEPHWEDPDIPMKLVLCVVEKGPSAKVGCIERSHGEPGSTLSMV